jgi:hypothetical protein
MSKYRTAEANRAYQRKWYEDNSHLPGVIYMLRNTVNEDTYIGLTRRPLKKRWQQFKAAAKGTAQSPILRQIREYGMDVFEMTELYRCEDGEDVNVKIVEFIELYSPTLSR